MTLEDAFNGATLALQLRVPEYDAGGRLTTRQRRLQVRVPRGVTVGKRIRLSGQGAPGFNGGPSGDLFLEVQIKPHPLYEVDGKEVAGGPMKILDIAVNDDDDGKGRSSQVVWPGTKDNDKVPKFGTATFSPAASISLVMSKIESYTIAVWVLGIPVSSAIRSTRSAFPAISPSLPV